MLPFEQAILKIRVFQVCRCIKFLQIGFMTAFNFAVEMR